MSPLIDNPVGNLPGPQFLWLYGAVIVSTLVACRWLLRRADPTRALTPLPVPPQPNAYEIAFLRAGEDEVTRAAIFALLQRD